MRFALVGCGMVGTARVSALAEIAGTSCVVCADVDPLRAEATARIVGCRATDDWQSAIADDDVQAVILASATNTHAVIAVSALDMGKHVFCESPLGRNPFEAEQMVLAAEKSGAVLATGASHRYTPTARRAKEFLEAGEPGEILFVRGISGRGAWGGMETWYSDPELSGGGTLMSNGIILLDLLRWFAGEFDEVVGYRDTALWPIRPVEDNAFGLFRRSDNGRVASLHSSWTDWSDRMQIGIYGSEGYLEIDLVEACIKHCRRTEGLPRCEERLIDLSMEPDLSCKLELEDFIRAVSESREPGCSGYDGLRAIRMAHALYRASDKKAAVRI